MKITMIGAGNMGGAIVQGLLRSGMAATDITIAKFAPSKPDTKFEALGCRSVSDPREACAAADTIIVAVKPWLVERILRQIKPHMEHRPILVSVAGGVSLAEMEQHISSAIFRAIPNTAAAVGESITFLCSDNADETQKTSVRELFERVGQVMEIDEEKFAAATALGSCGIAFAMRYIRASMLGAVEMGLPPKMAQSIVAQTLIGASTILKNDTETHPEAEIDKVTTPGGSTIRGVNAMDERGFSAAVVSALKATL